MPGQSTGHEDSTPSYREGSSVVWAGTDAGAGGVTVEDIPLGDYWFRLQVVRATQLGKFVVPPDAGGPGHDPLRWANR